MLTAYNAAPPAKSKMAARGPENGQRGLEMGLTLDYWPFRATFYLSTPSMRKGDDGETGKTGGKKENDENSGH